MAHFKPPNDAFLVEVNYQDRGSSKEWAYINVACEWFETSITAFMIAKEGSGTAVEVVVICMS